MIVSEPEPIKRPDPEDTDAFYALVRRLRRDLSWLEKDMLYGHSTPSPELIRYVQHVRALNLSLEVYNLSRLPKSITSLLEAKSDASEAD